jgi:hypothetical protein
MNFSGIMSKLQSKQSVLLSSKTADDTAVVNAHLTELDTTRPLVPKDGGVEAWLTLVGGYAFYCSLSRPCAFSSF